MFTSREDAGRKLGEYLRDECLQADVVLGLPRGGVVVAAEVARALEAPLDVLIVRKIGHPLHREFAVGALAEGGVVVFDEVAGQSNVKVRAALERIVEEEKERMLAYESKFHLDGPPQLHGKTVLLVDDGIATGATTEAAVASARRQRARSIVVAAPVASTNAVERLRRVADDMRVLWVDPEFDAVGRYYDVFTQTTDAEVIDLLRAEVRRH
jgi:predicted phosphoribosyltransferase